jgi:hypothetical protein
MVGGQNDAGWLFAKVMDGSLPVDRLNLISGAPMMEIKVFTGVFGEVLMKVFVRAARGLGRALLPRTSWTCPGSFSAPRKGLNGPRRG